MSRQFENIDELFSEKLKSLSRTPSPGVWNNISKELEKKNRGVVIPLYLKVAASIVLFIGFGSLTSYLLFNSSSKTHIAQNQVIEKTENIIEKDTIEEITLQNSSQIQKTTPSAENNAIISASERTKNSFANKTNQPETFHSDLVNSDQMLASVVGEEKSVNAQSKDGSQKNLYNTKAFRTITLSGSKEEKIEYPEDLKQKINNNAQIAANIQQLAQETSEQPEKQSTEWLIGGQFGPQYSDREITANNDPDYSTADYNNMEDGVLAYAGGINVNMKPTKRLSIQSGIYYSKAGQRNNNAQINYSQSKNGYSDGYAADLDYTVHYANSVGTIESSNNNVIAAPITENIELVATNPEDPRPSHAISYNQVGTYDISLQQNFEYLEIPFIIRYKLIDRKLDFQILGGLSTNLMIGNKVYLVDNNQYYEWSETSGNTVNYSSSLGFGIEFPFTNKLFFNLEPVFKYYLSPIRNEYVTSHPYTIGVMTGVSYSF